MSNSAYYSWNELREEIQNRMLECQEEQGNPRNPEVFRKILSVSKDNGGFDWPTSGLSWYKILKDGKFDKFYEKYPKFDLSNKIDDLINKLETI